MPERIALQAAFTAVQVEGGIALQRVPGTADRWALGTKDGMVLVFDGDEAPDTMLDIRDRVQVAGEAGLLGLTFHPDFAANGHAFVSYTTPGGAAFLSRIARFTSEDGGRTIDPATELVILEIDQPYSNHNGGDVQFGPDGMLYAGWGDGGAHSDPRGNGQDVDTLLGSIVRIDVDSSTPYAIPPDNPFATGGGAPEIFAYGFRNPWRIAFDRDNGELWTGDVGQNLWEEVDRVLLGGNYGWNVKEAAECFGRDACDDADLVQPVAQYRNTGGASVVGGRVYRGSAMSDLVGAFVYSDYYTGTIWAVREGEAPQVLHRSGGRRIAAWTEDDAGELLGVHHGGGIVRMIPAPTPEGDDTFPRLLSATGCVRSDDPTVVTDELVPYDVALPFWSDGADKTRALTIPADATIAVGADGDFELPVRSVIVKSFFRDGAPIETRLLVRHDDGEWAGYGYAWRPDGSDADFVVDGLQIGAWSVPSIETCGFCHTEAAGGSLGLEAAQLDAASIDRFVARGFLVDPPAGDPLPAIDDESASMQARARAYLHVNCAQCHRPEGPSGRADLDLRIGTALADTGLCDAPSAGSADLPDPRVIAPGDPSRSTLVARMRSLGSIRMPPVSSAIVDDEGVAIIEAWIASLPSCP